MRKSLWLLLLVLSDQRFVYSQLKFTKGGQAYELEFIKRGRWDSVQHLVLFYENGSKREESYFKNKRYIDTLTKWDVNGKAWCKRVYRDSAYFEKEYFEKDFWEEGWYREIAGSPKMRTIDDSSNWIRYLVEDYAMKPYYIRIGVWKVFSETGVMVSQGKYLPENFISSHPGLNVIKRGFESEDWFFPGGFKFSGWYSGCTSYLKDGEWIYYNEIGNEIYKENYKDGLPVKMK